MRLPAAACALLACALLLPPAAADDPPPLTLDGLLEAFTAVPGFEAKFREEKHIALLAAPLVNEGTFHYGRPDLMARHTDRPARSSVVIKDDVLLMGDTVRSERIDVNAHPVVRQLLESFMPILRGDRAALEELYGLTFTVEDAAARRWRLELTPKVAPMNKAIARISFVGHDLIMERMTVEERGGDRTVTTFRDVNNERAYDEEERARVFALRPPAGR